MQRSEVESLYRAHGGVVLRRARRLLASEDDAREIVQEVFASLLDRPEQVRGESSITTWLYAATTHGCLNRLRNERTRSRLLRERPANEQGTPPASPERAAALRQLLARIPDELAQAAVYYYADEMTHEEIAAVMGCSRRHVGDLLVRLRERVEVS